MKQILIIIVAALLSCHDFAQHYANNWVFGDSAGLNFSTSPPSYFTSAIATLESCATISDSAGNILFYTNGEKVWNKDNLVMPHGDSLIIDSGIYGSLSSITQGVVIVPKPESKTLYYIFDMSSSGLRYSIVDISLNAGLGDVTEKNILIFAQPVTEKMQVVKHGNGRDWWLILYKWPDEIVGGFPVVGSRFKFVKFLITPDSIRGPFVQEDDQYAYEDVDWQVFLGQMKFSENGKKMICPQGRHLGIYDFDRCTGNFSNYYELKEVDSVGIYGSEFSEDGSKIYLSSSDYPPEIVKLYQYCLNCNDSVQYTKQIIYSAVSSDYIFDQMQLGIDNKIYLIMHGRYGPYGPGLINSHLNIINYPDQEGLLCSFDTLTIYIGDHVNSLALPNMPNYNLGALIGSDCDTLESGMGSVINSIPGQNNFSIYPNPSSGYFIISGNTIENDLTVELYDMTGEKIITRQQVKLNVPVYVNDMNNGVYEVILKKNDQILYSGKLVVMK